MSKRTLLLIIVLIIVTGLLLYIALKGPTITPPNYKPPVTTTTKPTAQSVLSFGTLSTVPSSTSATPTYSLPVVIQSGNNKVTAVQLELQYDPEVLTAVSLKQGIFLQNPVVLINQVDEKTGRISYALGISPADVGKVGQGTVAILSFAAKGKALTSTTISFLPKSLVTAEGITQSVLRQTTPITITVGQTTPTP